MPPAEPPVGEDERDAERVDDVGGDEGTLEPVALARHELATALAVALVLRVTPEPPNEHAFASFFCDS